MENDTIAQNTTPVNANENQSYNEILRNFLRGREVAIPRIGTKESALIETCQGSVFVNTGAPGAAESEWDFYLYDNMSKTFSHHCYMFYEKVDPKSIKIIFRKDGEELIGRYWFYHARSNSIQIIADIDMNSIDIFWN